MSARASLAQQSTEELARFRELLLARFTPEELDKWIDVFTMCAFGKQPCHSCEYFVGEGSCQRPPNPFCRALNCEVCGVACDDYYIDFEWLQLLVDKAEAAGVWDYPTEWR